MSTACLLGLWDLTRMGRLTTLGLASPSTSPLIYQATTDTPMARLSIVSMPIWRVYHRKTSPKLKLPSQRSDPRL